jgi:hypothetical protein
MSLRRTGLTGTPLRTPSRSYARTPAKKSLDALRGLYNALSVSLDETLKASLTKLSASLDTSHSVSLDNLLEMFKGLDATEEELNVLKTGLIAHSKGTANLAACFHIILQRQLQTLLAAQAERNSDRSHAHFKLISLIELGLLGQLSHADLMSIKKNIHPENQMYFTLKSTYSESPFLIAAKAGSWAGLEFLDISAVDYATNNENTRKEYAFQIMRALRVAANRGHEACAYQLLKMINKFATYPDEVGKLAFIPISKAYATSMKDKSPKGMNVFNRFISEFHLPDSELEKLKKTIDSHLPDALKGTPISFEFTDFDVKPNTTSPVTLVIPNEMKPAANPIPEDTNRGSTTMAMQRSQLLTSSFGSLTASMKSESAVALDNMLDMLLAFGVDKAKVDEIGTTVRGVHMHNIDLSKFFGKNLMPFKDQLLAAQDERGTARSDNHAGLLTLIGLGLMGHLSTEDLRTLWNGIKPENRIYFTLASSYSTLNESPVLMALRANNLPALALLKLTMDDFDHGTDEQKRLYRSQIYPALVEAGEKGQPQCVFYLLDMLVYFSTVIGERNKSMWVRKMDYVNSDDAQMPEEGMTLLLDLFAQSYARFFCIKEVATGQSKLNAESVINAFNYFIADLRINPVDVKELELQVRHYLPQELKRAEISLLTHTAFDRKISPLATKSVALSTRPSVAAADDASASAATSTLDSEDKEKKSDASSAALAEPRDAKAHAPIEAIVEEEREEKVADNADESEAAVEAPAVHVVTTDDEGDANAGSDDDAEADKADDLTLLLDELPAIEEAPRPSAPASEEKGDGVAVSVEKADKELDKLVAEIGELHHLPPSSAPESAAVALEIKNPLAPDVVIAAETEDEKEEESASSSSGSASDDEDSSEEEKARPAAPPAASHAAAPAAPTAAAPAAPIAPLAPPADANPIPEPMYTLDPKIFIDAPSRNDLEDSLAKLAQLLNENPSSVDKELRDAVDVYVNVLNQPTAKISFEKKFESLVSMKTQYEDKIAPNKAVAFLKFVGACVIALLSAAVLGIGVGFACALATSFAGPLNSFSAIAGFIKGAALGWQIGMGAAAGVGLIAGGVGSGILMFSESAKQKKINQSLETVTLQAAVTFGKSIPAG